ncbi:MAG: protein kinase [Anaerolineae bacterium]|nr:protein kinase [Anaerolineae bacterium]
MAKKANDDGKDLLAGKLLGHYRLDRMLASGGMARIYRAEDTNLDRIVAVKVLMRELIEMDDTLTERFEREAKAVAALEHDNIIRVYDYRRHKDLYYIVMNYIEGKDLADELNDLRRRGKLMDVDRAFRILGPVASALDFAHAAGIIHRDVKPSNILLDKNDKAILTDFGLVLRQSVDQTLGTAFGTPRYISPEQALASEKSVPQSDIYSLAVIVYEILTGDLLFRADTPMQIALSHISEPPPRPRSVNPDIPEAVERELLKALEKEPLKRHRSATEFINSVKAAYAAVNTGKVTRPPSNVRTPVFNEAQEMKQGIQAALSSSQADATPRLEDNRPSTKIPAVPEPKASVITPSRRFPVPVMAGGAVAILAIVAVLAFSALNAANNNGVTGDPTAESNTPVTPQLVSGGVPLKLVYNSTALVILNENAADLDVSGLTLAKPGAEAGIPGTEIRQNMIPAGDCVSLVQVGRDFDARDWKCQGKDYDQVDVAGQSLFWRTPKAAQFEVRVNGTVIALCETTNREQNEECVFNLPG